MSNRVQTFFCKSVLRDPNCPFELLIDQILSRQYTTHTIVTEMKSELLIIAEAEVSDHTLSPIMHPSLIGPSSFFPLCQSFTHHDIYWQFYFLFGQVRPMIAQ